MSVTVDSGPGGERHDRDLRPWSYWEGAVSGRIGGERRRRSAVRGALVPGGRRKLGCPRFSGGAGRLGPLEVIQRRAAGGGRRAARRAVRRSSEVKR